MCAVHTPFILYCRAIAIRAFQKVPSVINSASGNLPEIDFRPKFSISYCVIAHFELKDKA